MKHSKKDARLKRAKKLRITLRKKNVIRLVVNRTSQNIYAQIISGCGSKTLASASSLNIKNGGNIDAAKKVGDLIAKAAKKAKIESVVFDRSGFKYHGRIKALADSARETGLKF
ncbi:LSU ribosomal protein L18p (L5e) [hydrothermal vent metagenome]|uniref:LSU ribosomal protein L18p (L5e) n=1 Tax=hydrothermal vent metagenome TaxID=652676 RepID=A0A1W1BK58_9ZZZZ